MKVATAALCIALTAPVNADEVTWTERFVIENPPVTYSIDELIVFIHGLGGYWKIEHFNGIPIPGFCITKHTDKLCSYIPKHIASEFMDWARSGLNASQDRK